MYCVWHTHCTVRSLFDFENSNHTKKIYTVWYDCSCELIIFEISNALWSKSHAQLSEKQTERMETNEKKKKLKCGKNKTEYEMWFS